MKQLVEMLRAKRVGALIPLPKARSQTLTVIFVLLNGGRVRSVYRRVHILSCIQICLPCGGKEVKVIAVVRKS